MLKIYCYFTLVDINFNEKKMLYKSGYNIYGYAIGILVLETKFPRIPGDMGNATSFSFPVRYKVVKGASPQRVVDERDQTLLHDFIKAAKELELEGVRAITTTCGYLAMFQKELSKELNIPIFTSSLLQVPLVHSMLKPEEKVGIIVANAKTFHPSILEAVGAKNIPVAITGMEEQYEFTFMRREMNRFNPNKVEKEVINVAKELIDCEPKIRAFVVEDANLPPYSKALQMATKLPIFDFMTLTNWVNLALIKNQFGRR